MPAGKASMGPVRSTRMRESQVNTPASTLELPPQADPLPQLVLTPEASPCSPPPVDYFRTMDPGSMSAQSEEEPEEEPEKAEQELSEGQLGANFMRKYTELGKGMGTILSSLQSMTSKFEKSEKHVNDLRAVAAEKEELLKKAEEEVLQAKSGEAAVKNECMKLNEMLKVVKSKSAEKDAEMKKLKEKVSLVEQQLDELGVKVKNEFMKIDMEIKELNEKGSQLREHYDEKVNKLEVMVSDWEKSEKELEEHLNEKEEQIDLLNKKVDDKETKIEEQQAEIFKQETSKDELRMWIIYFKGKILEVENKCKEQLSKLNSHLEQTKKALECKTEEEEANRTAIQDLESQKNNFKASFDQLQAEMLTKSEEHTKILKELEKKKDDNEAKRIKLLEKKQKVRVLKEKVKALQQEKSKVSAALSQLSLLTSPETGRKRPAPSLSSSSSSESEIDEPSSVAVNEKVNGGGNSGTVTEEAEQPLSPDVTPTTSVGGRRYPERKRGRKRCRGAQCSTPDHDTDDLQQNSSNLSIYVNEKYYTGDGTEMPETSGSNSSRGKQQRKKSDGEEKQA